MWSAHQGGMITETIPLATNHSRTSSYAVPGNPRTAPKHLRGLKLGVLRPADGSDYTAGGISARFTTVVLVGVLNTLGRAQAVTPMPADAQVVSAGPGAPAVALEIRRIGEPVASLVPVSYDTTLGYYVRAHQSMAGGNHATFSDSRIGDLVQSVLGRRFYGALAIHDRAV